MADITASTALPESFLVRSLFSATWSINSAFVISLTSFRFLSVNQRKSLVYEKRHLSILDNSPFSFSPIRFFFDFSSSHQTSHYFRSLKGKCAHTRCQSTKKKGAVRS